MTRVGASRNASCCCHRRQHCPGLSIWSRPLGWWQSPRTVTVWPSWCRGCTTTTTKLRVGSLISPIHIPLLVFCPAKPLYCRGSCQDERESRGQCLPLQRLNCARWTTEMEDRRPWGRCPPAPRPSPLSQSPPLRFSPQEPVEQLPPRLCQLGLRFALNGIPSTEAQTVERDVRRGKTGET